MFDNIFGLEAIMFMIHLADGLEDADAIAQFRTRFIRKMDYPIVMALACKWNQMEERNQVKVAVRYMSEDDASRFIMYMDYLSHKIDTGEIK